MPKRTGTGRSGDQKKNRNGVPVRSGSKRILVTGRWSHHWSTHVESKVSVPGAARVVWTRINVLIVERHLYANSIQHQQQVFFVKLIAYKVFVRAEVRL